MSIGTPGSIETGPATGGGGGSSDIHTAHVTLRDAQIKASPTGVIDVLPAPGANKLLLFDRAVLVSHFQGGGYTNLATLDVNGTDVNVSFVFDLADWGFVCSQFLNNGIDHTPWNAFLNASDDPESIFFVPQAPVSGWPKGPAAFAVDKPLELWVHNGGLGAFTGGDPANTLDIVIRYLILNTLTYTFE